MRTRAKVLPEGTDNASGIFGPHWHNWRGATLAVELDGEPPFVARLDAVGSVQDGIGGPKYTRASLTILDAQGCPQEVRTVPWPPTGSVRVVRMK